MAISDKDRKVLWARSGNRCALCRRQLVAERTATDREAVVGDEAHIAAQSPGGPRYDEFPTNLTDSYDNLVLLCRVDHKKVDDQPEYYTSTVLRQKKSDHELWVDQSLQRASSSESDGMVDGAKHAECWPTPQQLPPAPPRFVRRQPELRAITQAAAGAAEDTKTVILTLTGPGGIGKTSVALRWAHLHAHHYPDGQLYVDLHGFSPSGEPITAATALRGLLHALDVKPDRVPEHVDAQTALYRSLVAGKRMLMVLDNAATIEQVVPLLPGNTAGIVLVTSRHRLTGLTVKHGAQPIPVGFLTETDARALLEASLGAQRMAAEPAAIDAMLVGCKGLPLALSIVAGNAQTHPERTLSTLADELRDTATRFDALDAGDPATSLRAVLSWSQDALTSQQHETFALLGLAPGSDVSLSAAARLTGQTKADTKRLLTTLEEASLLHCDDRGRYWMHDLVRAYAITVAEHDLTKGASEHAIRRLLDFYVHTAHKADQLLHPQRRPTELAPSTPAIPTDDLQHASDALAWFTVEHSNLRAAQDSASTLRWWPTTWQLAWAMATYHQRQGYRDDRIAVWIAALDAATNLDNPAARIRAHRHLGHAYADLNQFPDAFENLNLALILAQEHDVTVQQAHTHRTLAWMWERAGKHQTALEHAEQALILYQYLGRPVDEATSLNQVGWLKVWRRDSMGAREHCNAALVLHRSHHNHDGEAHTLDSLGWIAENSGCHHEAVDHYLQALRIHRTLGNNYSVANTLDRLGVPYQSLRLYEKAQATWQEALTLYQQQERDDVERVQRRLDYLTQLSSHRASVPRQVSPSSAVHEASTE
ncbi:NB-ARC domain-containing protein [Amycolatopsis sp. NPDC058278]|uniref:NB-ARC domain-containing protein n=1 Tax=Amycolatopsis sp. NPDC058278 TaxID=3346417 RepID=UPI0036DE45F4